MSQKGGDFDPSNKNNFFPNANLPSSGQFIPPPNSQYPMPPTGQHQMPYGMGPNPWEWWNNPYAYGPPMPNPGMFEPNYRDEASTKSQVFNQFTPQATPNKQPPSTSDQQQKPLHSNSVADASKPSQQQFPPGAPGAGYAMPSFMDPASAAFMYYQMQMQQPPFGYHPAMYNPYMGPMMPNFGMYGSASLAGGQRQLQDDQQSMHSYHFENLDQRDRKPSISQSQAAHLKTEPVESNSRGGLLMEDPNQSQLLNTEIIGLTTAVTDQVTASSETTKSDEMKHRLTPPLYPQNKPHVRGTFSLNNLVQVRPNEPCEGQPALVDILNLTDLMEQYMTKLKNMKTMETNELTEELEDESNISSETRNELLINYKLLQEFPGPLVKENTSKAQLIQFCQKNVKECLSNQNANLIDPQSHALLWDYLALLVRQNGLVDLKTDISPLLLSVIDSQVFTAVTSTTTTTSLVANKMFKTGSSASLASLARQDFVMVSEDSSNNSNIDDLQTISRQNSQPNNLHLNNTLTNLNTSNKPAQITDEDLHLNKLRQLLGAGQKHDAIECAIKYNMWPHALFLSSSTTTTGMVSVTSTGLVAAGQLGGQTIANSSDFKALNKVKLKYINSLHPNDPIHTCYQLLVGRVPSVASNLPKAEWNDWRRHLAMIVSNVDEYNRDLVLNSIRTMGDSLASSGRVAASHFCYLLANCSFGSFEKKSSKLVLIGSSHNQDFNKFCQINAIQATEIYEFAMSFSAPNLLEHFVKYKLIYTTRLLEYGLINEAYKYIEAIAKVINENPQVHSSKISTVFQLANRLRVHDPDFTPEDLNDPSNDPQWFQELTSNYQKVHLNNLWHLLPAATASNLTSQHDTTLTALPSISTANNNNLNVNTKNEPHTGAEPSPVIPDTIPNGQESNQEPHDFTSTNVSYQKQQQQHVQANSLANNLNALSLNDVSQQAAYNSQESMPFYSNTTIGTTNVIDANNENLFQDQQSQQGNSNNYPYNNQDAYSQMNQQVFNPAEYQAPSYQPRPDTYENTYQQQSRKSSISSVSNSNNVGQVYNQQHNYTNNNNVGLYQPNTARGESVSSNYSGPKQHAETNRSRLSSMSTSGGQNEVPTFYNQQPQQQLFDPSSGGQGVGGGMQRSTTYPVTDSNHFVKEERRDDRLTSSVSAHDTNSTNNNNSKIEEDLSDEDLGVGNPKPRSQAEKEKDAKKQEEQQSEGLFSRIYKKIVPKQPPRMVLPDDKKKTIYWDEKLKRYVNKDAADDPVASIKPPPIFLPTNPPKAEPSNQHQASTNSNTTANPTSFNPSNLDQPSQSSQQFSQQQQQSSAESLMPPVNSTPNRFSLKNAGKRTNYYSNIDVMADKAKKLPTGAPDPSLMLSHVAPPSQMPPKFFVPQVPLFQPANDTHETESQQANNPEAPTSDNVPNNFQQMNQEYEQQQQQHQQQPAMYQTSQQFQPQPQMYANPQNPQFFQPQQQQDQPQMSYQQYQQPGQQQYNDTGNYANNEHSDELTTDYSYYNNQDYDHHHNFTHDGLDDETDENSNSHESYIESGRTSSSNDSTFASNPHNQQHQYDQYNNTNSYQYHYGNNV